MNSNLFLENLEYSLFNGVFNNLNVNIYICHFYKVNFNIYFIKNRWQTQCSKSTSVSVDNKEKSLDPSSVKGLQSTVVNRGCPSLHIRLLKNTLSVPLKGL